MFECSRLLRFCSHRMGTVDDFIHRHAPLTSHRGIQSTWLLRCCRRHRPSLWSVTGSAVCCSGLRHASPPPPCAGMLPPSCSLCLGGACKGTVAGQALCRCSAWLAGGTGQSGTAGTAGTDGTVSCTGGRRRSSWLAGAAGLPPRRRHTDPRKPMANGCRPTAWRGLVARSEATGERSPKLPRRRSFMLREPPGGPAGGGWRVSK
jgi:hypothetical protein